MKSLSFVVLITFLSMSHARAADTYLQGFLGFNSGAVNFGVDYEQKKSETFGVGAYFLYGSDDEDLLVPQTMNVGAMIRFHIINDDKFDVSIAPGFGVVLAEFPGDTDETILGPSMKLGFLYKLSNGHAIGLEYFETYNWLNDDVSNLLGTSLISVGYRIEL